MRTNGIILFLVGTFALMFSGCSKDEEAQPEVKLPSIAKDSTLVDVPDKLQNPTNKELTLAASVFNAINEISSTARMMLPPKEASTFHADIPGAVAYTWSAEGMTYWFTYHTRNDTCYWKVEIDMGEGRTPYIEGKESCDGKSGEIILYGEGLTPFSAQWNYDSDGNLTFKIQSGLYMMRGTLNADGSGSAKVYFGGNLAMEIWWNADGSGHYKYYMSYPPSEGSWSS